MSEKNYFMDGPITPDFIAGQIAGHAAKKNIGAHAIFLGQVRADKARGAKVEAIEYSAYAGMANGEISRLREEAFTKFPLNCLHVYHSTGRVAAGEISLFVFVSAAHRKESMRAMEWIVEEIKHNVPVWKKECLSDGQTRWIDGQPE